MSGGEGQSGTRSFLFLQGPTSGVFRELGRALARRGHKVLKVNFCPGDWLFWRGSDTQMYQGTLDAWPEHLRALIAERRVTDIIYFADRFPYHKAAQKVARAEGVRSVSMEYGYLRPDWLILEEGGQSTYSHFPRDPEKIRAIAGDLDPVDEAQIYDIPSIDEMIRETAFHVSNGLFGWLTPRYTPDRYYPVFVEFPAYLPRLVRRRLNAAGAEAMVEGFEADPRPRFLVPLQMQNDYQLRDNAPKGFQTGFIEQVMASFRDHAPAEAELVFKVHPMDNGLERWDRVVPRLARQYGIADRVKFLDGGQLPKIFSLVAGCVVINSTTGLIALRRAVPTKVMGVAVYDMEGLTHQGDLDGFWTRPQKPARDMHAALVRAMAHGIHVRGAVYGPEGRAAFVRNAIDRLEQPIINQHGLYEPHPPRVEKAAALGIAVDWPMGKEAP
jgi:capsular polysaccharide export protein